MHGRTTVLARVIGAILFCSPIAARGERFEVELGAGAAKNIEHSPAPVVSLRVGTDFVDVFAPGIRATAMVGPDVPRRRGDPAANRAWSVLAELRMHTPGRVQAYLDLGVGVGRLVQEGSRLDFTAMAGSTGLAFQIGAGMRAHLASRLTMGIGLVMPVWTGVASDLREDIVGTIGPASRFVEIGLWGLVGTTF